MAIRFLTGETVDGSATFTGNVTATNILTVAGAATGSPFLQFTQGGTQKAYIQYLDSVDSLNLQSDNQFVVRTGGSTSALTINSSQNATFVGDVTVSGGDITLGGTGRIQGVDTVSSNTDAANKLYVDNAISGLPAVNNGTLTMTTSTGLDGGATFTANQSGNSTFAVTLDLTEITLGVGLDSTATGLSLDLSEFVDMTAAMLTTDEFIVLDSGAERRKAAGEIGLSIFLNDLTFMTSWTLSADSGTNQTISNGNTVDIAGGTNITTVVGATDTVTINMDTGGAGAGSYGSTSNSVKIDTITLDAYGRVTAVATGATGSGSMSSFTLTGDSGSNQTIGNGNTLDIAGGTNISTVVGATDTLTINMDTGGAGAGTYGSTANGTKIDNITLDAYGRVTAVTTGATGSGSVTSIATPSDGGLTGGTITTSGSLRLKNYSSLTSNRLLKWDNTNNQLTNSNVSDNGTTVSVIGTGGLSISGAGGLSVISGDIFTNNILTFSNSTASNDLVIGDVLENDEIETIALKCLGSTIVNIDDSEVVINRDIVLEENSDLNLDSNSFIKLKKDAPVNGSSTGTILSFGSQTVSPGLIYYLNGLGTWTLANQSNSGATRMLAIPVGTNASTGMLLEGILRISSHGFQRGLPLYLNTTNGGFTTTVPTTPGNYARIVGYAVDTNFIYFNPDKTWVQIA